MTTQTHSHSHTIQKGYDLPLAGAAPMTLANAREPRQVVLETVEFPGIKPKVLVKEGDEVVTGQPIFLDKRDRDVVWCSPVTGRVARLDFGERRFLLRAVLENSAASGGKESHAEPVRPAEDRDELLVAIKRAGLWPLFRQRPGGKLPDSSKVPVAIYVNGMDTAPLAANPGFAVQGHKQDLQAGIDLLKRLTPGKVYLTLAAAGDHQTELRDLRHVEVHDFRGPHPSGLVGTHISCIRPLKAGETCWALRAQDVVRLGAWARSGHYPAHTVVAVAGSAAAKPGYFRVRQSAEVVALNDGQPFVGDLRIIDGTVLHGRALQMGAATPDAALGFFCTTLTVMPEGTDQRDLFGWALPQFGKLSTSRSVFSWLLPKKEYVVDARLNGGHRPIVNIGAWERVMPLDIHPTFLVRAIQANDLDEAIKLGLLEVTEEDVALCTFVDPCKIDVGSIIRQGLDMFEKEG